MRRETRGLNFEDLKQSNARRKIAIKQRVKR